MPTFYFGCAMEIITWATSRKCYGVLALYVFCCLVVSCLVFSREGKYKKHSDWKAWPVDTYIISLSDLEEANGDLLSSCVFLLCISAQEKDIHTRSLKSQGCHALRERDFHLLLKLAVTAGAQPAAAVCELKRFLLTAC